MSLAESLRVAPPRWQAVLPWVLVAILVAIGYRSVLPPAPLDADAPAAEFSAARAFEHIATIAREPHPMGTPEIEEVRSYLVSELEGLGIEVDLQAIRSRNPFDGPAFVDVVNVIGRIPGTDSTKSIALMAHYDTVPTTPGANDNSASVAALLEAGRALLTGPPVRNDILLLFTDGEEPSPRFGSPAIVDGHPLMRDLGLVVNLEASGGRGAAILAETNGPQHWLIRELAAADSHPAAFSFVTNTTQMFGDLGTDFDPFRNAGVSGFHFAYLHDSPIYHTPNDNIDSVDRGSVQNHGSHALGIARHFGDIDLATAAPAGDAVFFTIRPLFIHYSAGWVVPLAIVALVLCLFAMRRWLHKTRISIGELAVTTAKLTGIGLLSIIGATLIWLGVVAIRTSPGLVEAYTYFAVLLVASLYLPVRFASGRQEAGAAVLLIWVTMAEITALTLPGFSYLFTWPSIAGAVALLLDTARGSGRDWLRFAVLSTVTLLLLIPPIDFFLQFAQPRPGNLDSQVASSIALPILLALLVVPLVRVFWPDRRSDA